MDMPKPTEQHKKLAKFEGTWVGQEKNFPSPMMPQGGNTTARWTFKMGLGGFFLIHDYQQETGGHASYQGHALYGWDGEKNRYTMYWFDGMGGTPEVIPGKWEGNGLVFEQATPGRGTMRYTHRWEGDDKFTFLMENAEDGKTFRPTTEGHFTRK
ncbi:MAG: DUF1579 family protein [Myxococcales bacterium]